MAKYSAACIFSMFAALPKVEKLLDQPLKDQLGSTCPMIKLSNIEKE